MLTTLLMAALASATAAPVMLAVDTNHVNLTGFRAQWIDAATNVASYTLQVNKLVLEPYLMEEADFYDLPAASGNQAANASQYLPAGWTFTGYTLYLDGGSISPGPADVIATRTYDLTGYDKVTVEMIARTYPSSYYSSLVDVATSKGKQRLTLSTTWGYYSVTLDCAEQESITFTSAYYPQFQNIKVYAGEVQDDWVAATATEQGESTYRLVTSITGNSYTVTGLQAGGTFEYKVKAVYTNGTESDWSNVQTVTLREYATAGNPDINDDGAWSMADVTTLIAYVLGNNPSPCLVENCDVSGDGAISMADVTTLIANILGN